MTETNEVADLAMRIKALEVDVAEHGRRIGRMTEVVNELASQVEDLRRRARLAY